MKDIIDTLSPHFFLRFGLELLTLIALIIYIRNRVKAHKVTRELDKKPWKPTYVHVNPIGKPYYLFFDTETTGLPKDFSLPAAADDNWPKLVQLSWIVTDKSGEVITSEDHIIKPVGFTIPKEASKINGITTDIALAKGEDLKDVLGRFNKDCERCCLCVGHNIPFDKKVVGSEFLRLGMQDPVVFMPEADTMSSSIYYCRIPKRNGKYKRPRLQELYKKMFGHKFNGAHNSMCDVTATKECFFELVRHGVINIRVND